MFTGVLRVVLVWLLLNATSWAQQIPGSGVSTAAAETAAEEPVAEKTGDEDADPGVGQATGIADIEPGEDQQAEEAASETPGASPPGEYRASEQISDDLSVSFPVDI